MVLFRDQHCLYEWASSSRYGLLSFLEEDVCGIIHWRIYAASEGASSLARRAGGNGERRCRYGKSAIHLWAPLMLRGSKRYPGTVVATSGKDSVNREPLLQHLERTASSGKRCCVKLKFIGSFVHLTEHFSFIVSFFLL
ncbi:hypothetical protein DPMN_097506 [Dreissena polymorpha]|uniref:Uncharacterized protein n=1 Tax=Dreissena polymorpha TaxID=45954 RepID=A0A9D4LB89_DREPO|nr:hypothetical protein DPMN_097506 [Dreissena polymorpha]